MGYKNKVKYPIHVSKKCCGEKHVLLLIRGEDKRHYFFIKDFSTFVYDHKLHRGRIKFCRNCLQVFSTQEILERLI